MSLLPPDDELDLLHTRQYETRVYQRSDDELLVRGVVCDVKPPGLYVEGDPAPLEMHRMRVDLLVALPKLTITRAEVAFESHPHHSCPLIASDYRRLEGLSIARGFNQRVRELFGGPRGCTHTNALLQAMAPAVVQSTWSLSVRRARAAHAPPGVRGPEERERRVAANANTCHVWSEDGEHVASLRRGEGAGGPPLPVRERLRAMGRGEEDWK